ncbi:MAG: hypothetical protein DRJ64_08875 [Thermoprotei archaeon]|nr:MAG: hypothetical protein DRJ64_08875 [Thermoprotei archaeon]
MPVMPFLLGMVAGSVITYVVKDESSGKQLLEDTSSKITSGAGNLTNKVTDMFKKAEESVEEKVTQSA